VQKAHSSHAKHSCAGPTPTGTSSIGASLHSCPLNRCAVKGLPTRGTQHLAQHQERTPPSIAA